MTRCDDIFLRCAPRMYSAGLPGSSAGIKTRVLKKTYIHVPPGRNRTDFGRMIRVLVGIVLSPLYWLLAGFYGAPGLRFRLKCAVLGAHLIFNRNSQIPYRTIFMLICWPIDSVRYFEFDFMWGVLSEPSFREYLDVSSPRLFPIILLRNHFDVSAELVNPDKADLAISEALVKACRLSSRCKLRGCLVENAPFAPQSFDLITSISVIEHIREDTEAIRNIWSLLKPGGRLLLSVPCVSEAE